MAWLVNVVLFGACLNSKLVLISKKDQKNEISVQFNTRWEAAF